MPYASMSAIGFIIVTLFGGLCMADQPNKAQVTVNPETCPYLKAPESPKYASATAGNPYYDDTVLWPLESRKSYYAKQVWPKGRLWIWAKPGVSMKSSEKPLNPTNWLEDGKPATNAADAETDFEFPSAPGNKRYFVDFGGQKNPMTVRRHLTINAGVNVAWLHQANGNTWIKKGGILQVLTNIAGNGHAFLRNDNATSWWMVDHLYCNKAPEASIEIIGAFSVDDSYHFNSGMTILAEGSAITPQARCTLNVQQNASLVLLSGATYRKQANQTFGCDLIVRGKLLAGLPERPLTSDCTIGLSWKGKRQFLPGEANTFRTELRDDVALIVMPEFQRSVYSDKGGWQKISDPAGVLKVYSANPTKARLILDWNGLDLGSETAKSGAENFAKLKEIKDRNIEMYLLGDLDLNGVVFNHIGKGGIIVKDPTEVKNWKNIVWGKDNAAKPDELIRNWDGKPQSLFNNAKDF